MDTDASANARRELRIAEYWYATDRGDERDGLVYRPAVLVDCRVNFRSLKAGINHSEEGLHTAWLGAGSLPVDWDTPAIPSVESSRLAHAPDPRVRMPETRPDLEAERFDELETDLVDGLVRQKRLVLFRNPLFEIFSDVDEPRENFLDRTAEVALQKIEPELKRLKQVFELQLEQIRERHINKRGAVAADATASQAVEGQAEIERMLESRTEFVAVEKRVTSLFTGLAGFVLQMPFARPQSEETAGAFELREDLARLEQEAADALNELYTRYLEMVRSYDEFEVRIQPSNVRVLRRALLWVAAEARPAANANTRESES
jgi:hypothetical protein